MVMCDLRKQNVQFDPLCIEEENEGQHNANAMKML